MFDRYNFTVNEAEPLEKEVAIDPEMLGKVFENLIEENRRKGLGSFYTPREIVHYMCQESLINYLDTAINSYAEAIGREKRKQAQFGDEKAEQTLLTAPVRQEVVPRADLETFVHLGDQYSFYEAAKQSGTIGRDYPKPPKSIEQHARLIDDKLADITICDPAVGSGAFPVGMMTEIVRARSALTPYFNDVQDRTPYHFKRHAIQDCLYGVDIDPGAVEIAKLRLWLSLVVDEEDVKQIKPLPNLFYKIVTGNSLLGVEKNLFNQQLFQKLEKLKPLYFDQTDSSKKSNLKHQIDQIIHELTNGKEAFDFEIYFSEVFHGKGGFDVVIANPPYGIVFDRILKAKYESAYPTFKRNNDLYVAFYQRGVGLSRQRGHLTYISPNTFLNGDYFKKLREFLTAATVLRKVWDYKSVPIFDDPTVFVCVLTCTKDRATATPYHVSLHVAASSATSFQTTAFQITGASEEPFKSLNPILQRSLRRRGFAELDSHFFVKDVGFNYWTEGRGKTRGQNSIGDRVFYAGQQLNERDMPFLKGRDIHKWHIQEPSNFLRHNYERLLNDADTLRYSSEFLSLKPKVVYRQTANTIIAAIDSAGSFVDKTVHLIVPRQNWNACSPRLLVALLNSKLFAYF
ncbi:MAG: N-6 DNA methylase [Verrucomicrobia bacterium]|nr:N-6 DNA methylase [Verrucomicrobiota bacterium]